MYDAMDQATLQQVMQQPDKAKLLYVRPVMVLMETVLYQTGPNWPANIRLTCNASLT